MASHLLALSFVGTKVLGPERTAAAFRAVAKGKRRLRFWRAPRSLDDVRARVERGYRFLPLPVECLDQAMVTWYLLNAEGHPATLRIGMKLSPFLGHAWVESRGEVLGAIPGIEDMAIVSEIGPIG
ncbi:MAG: lasso peptide biosynthesis B2 protein [Polyangiaceae bacterium]